MRVFSALMRRSCAFFLMLALCLCLQTAGHAHGQTLEFRCDDSLPPYEFLAYGRAQGFTVDLVQAIARDSGLHVQIIPGPWHVIKAELDAGNTDALTGIYYTRERARQVLFSEPYTVVSHSIFVRKGSRAMTAEDLKGAVVAVQRNDIMHEYAQKHLTGSALLPCTTRLEALQAVSDGRAEAALLGRLMALQLMYEHNITNVTVSGEALLTTPLCFGFAPDRKDIMVIFNEGLAHLRMTGEFDVIYEKWFGRLERRAAEEVVRRYAAWVLTPLFFIMAAGLCWLVILKKRLARRTLQLQIQVEKLQETEKALAESERQYRSIFETIRDGFYRADMQGRIVLCNPAAADMLGYSMEELAGKNIAQDLYRHPYERRKLLSHLEREEAAANVQVEMLHKNGSIVLIETNSRLVRDETTGEPVAVEGVIRDVTARNRLEALIARTEKMISLGGLASGMAHEINNPLGAILQGVQNISRRLDSRLAANIQAAADSGISTEGLEDYIRRRNIRKLLHSVRSAGEQAAGIVRSMLSFSQTGTPVLMPSDINALTERVITLVRSECRLSEQLCFSDIALHVELASGLPPVPCSPAEIEQVLLHLLRNAAQALAHGKTTAPRITIRTALDARHIRIEVEDNGPGVDEDTARRIFDPFFTTREVGQGTGLGLSVAYFIVTQNHNGSIYHEPAESGGVRFVIRLPLFPGAPSGQDARPSSAL
ncbi:transporter substrate-binding domain-containing protein [Oleidesulfovibrio alaskensis]|uniref:transporter substrate-binding domain-containing protein n=1 Tax=Oleidesulfovibrio alaskensis TaxID=58180 RepID=UPI001A531949|nr:transporter substrate-binding domain-containing protein [Oleidesulfovibrio alaskensis]MBL3582036.1 transporter substrate-binding domain-containing protein [Oleidesulfovibrio alaskensis]